MTPDLLQSYFERDLSEPEMQRLAELLEDGEDNAARFAGLAAAAFAALKIPEGRQVQGMGPALKGLLALTVGAGTLVAVWRAQHQAALPKPEETLAATATPQILTAPPGPAQPPSLPAPPLSYDAMSVLVSQKKPGLVTVRVLTLDGVEIRRLFAGILEAGSWRFVWDGKDTEGRALPPGRYRIQVKSGPVEQSKDIEIKKG